MQNPECHHSFQNMQDFGPIGRGTASLSPNLDQPMWCSLQVVVGCYILIKDLVIFSVDVHIQTCMPTGDLYQNCHYQ